MESLIPPKELLQMDTPFSDMIKYVLGPELVLEISTNWMILYSSINSHDQPKQYKCCDDHYTRWRWVIINWYPIQQQTEHYTEELFRGGAKHLTLAN